MSDRLDEIKKRNLSTEHYIVIAAVAAVLGALLIYFVIL